MRSGRPEAFAEQYDRYASRLKGFALSLTGDNADADDLVQETLMAARYFHQFSMGCSDKLGRDWHVAGGFHGEVDILDANGELGARLINGIGTMQNTVAISTSGETFSVQGAGRHEVQRKDGSLYGYAVLRPLSQHTW